MDVYMTPYSEVRLSEKTLAYLKKIHPDWREIYLSSMECTKPYKKQINKVFKALETCAAIEWQAGGVMEVF